MKRITVVLALIFSMVVCAVAFGDAAAAPGASGWLQEHMKDVLMGMGTGLIAALVGWSKSTDPATGQHQPFTLVEAWPTLLIGAAVGGYCGFAHKDLSDYTTWVQGSAYIVFAEMAWNALHRNSTVPLKQVLSVIGVGAAKPPASPPKPS